VIGSDSLSKLLSRREFAMVAAFFAGNALPASPRGKLNAASGPAPSALLPFKPPAMVSTAPLRSPRTRAEAPSIITTSPSGRTAAAMISEILTSPAGPSLQPMAPIEPATVETVCGGAAEIRRSTPLSGSTNSASPPGAGARNIG